MLTLDVVPPYSDPGRRGLLGFFTEVWQNFYQRELSDDEIREVMRDNLADGLEPPTGLLLVAWDDEAGDDVLGCAGLRLLGGGVGEVKHLHVDGSARGRGIGNRLMREIEARALAAGCSTLQLDTRADLLAARRLYTRLGFTQVPRFNDNPAAECWYQKSLR